MLVVGAGAGGCAMSAKFARRFGKGHVIVLEPSDVHYYQPLFTLAGGGIKTLEQSRKSMGDVLPRKAKWLKASAAQFEPEKNAVVTSKGDVINYEYLLIAVGLELNYDKVRT